MILGQDEPIHRSTSSLHTWGESFDDRSAVAMRAGAVNGKVLTIVVESEGEGNKGPLQPQPSLPHSMYRTQLPYRVVIRYYVHVQRGERQGQIASWQDATSLQSGVSQVCIVHILRPGPHSRDGTLK